MRLPKIYEPLTELDGFQMWNIDHKYDIYYFYYKIKVRNNCLRLFIYMFRHDNFSGAEYILDYPDKHHREVQEMIKQYKQTADRVLEKRERLKRLFD